MRSAQKSDSHRGNYESSSHNSGRMTSLQAKNFQQMRDIRNKSVTGPELARTLALERDTPGGTLHSNKNSPTKERLPIPSLDANTQKKLFGKLSI